MQEPWLGGGERPGPDLNRSTPPRCAAMYPGLARALGSGPDTSPRAQEMASPDGRKRRRVRAEHDLDSAVAIDLTDDSPRLVSRAFDRKATANRKWKQDSASQWIEFRDFDNATGADVTASVFEDLRMLAQGHVMVGTMCSNLAALAWNLIRWGTIGGTFRSYRWTHAFHRLQGLTSCRRARSTCRTEAPCYGRNQSSRRRTYL